MHIHHGHLHKRQFDLSTLDDSHSNQKNDFDDMKDNVNNFLNGGFNVQQDAHDKREGGNTATKVSIKYVTASKTFSGPVRGYTTIHVGNGNDNSHNDPTPAPESKPTETPKDTPKPAPTPASSEEESSTSTPKATPKSTKTSESAEPTKAAATKSSNDNDNSKPAATQTHTKTPLMDSISVTSSTPTLEAATSSTAAGLAAAGTTSSLPSVSPVAQNTGMSGGAKAGIAIGVILAILALAGAAFAAYRFKKNKDARAEESVHNEKNPFGDSAAAPAPAPAQMQMRPAAAPATMTSAAPAAAASGVSSTRDAQASNPANPFGNHAETVSTSQPAPMSQAPATSGPTMNGGEKAAMAAGAGAAAGGVIGAAVSSRENKHEKKNSGDGPKPLDVKAAQAGGPFAPALAALPPSPSGSQFSTTSMTSTLVASGAPTTNVHRVQLDFKPSMDDELDLKAGQLVRLLHEYDDGWALCIRMDRSQQGVVPRTCLSQRPVKPRNGPPMGPPGMRGPPPGMRGPPGPGRTASPGPNNGPRSQSPALRPNQNQRSMSPGPYGGGPQPQRPQNQQMRPRSNSDNNMEKRVGPAPGPSPMNPGQKPAVQDNSNFQLPIQIPRPLTPQGQSSTPVTPVTRKPVPTKSP